MQKNYELLYRQLEKDNWWCVARRDIILRLLQKYRIGKNCKILEVGCSGGALLKFLESKGFKNLYGIDISEDALDSCEKESVKNVILMDGENPKFSNERFNVIIASDILEHIQNDEFAVYRWREIMNFNGILIIFVPAFKLLWSWLDQANMHYHRYSKSTLKLILKKSGFKIERISYWNFMLFIPKCILIVIQNILFKKTNINRLYELPPAVNILLIKLMKLENAMLDRFDFPVGVSVFAIARKPSNKNAHLEI